jgi:hypothetical protein
MEEIRLTEYFRSGDDWLRAVCVSGSIHHMSLGSEDASLELFKHREHEIFVKN